MCSILGHAFQLEDHGYSLPYNRIQFDGIQFLRIKLNILHVEQGNYSFIKFTTKSLQCTRMTNIEFDLVVVCKNGVVVKCIKHWLCAWPPQFGKLAL